ncbi:MAG TPA: cytochrome c [Chromatiaceae bacterium]|jgi:cytochrome c553|nr:cytochrome c [Chromatiaceae bacterium]HIB84570.1 cytochrome c [Chromatiaceae bacterium]HIN82130.1 cytochrome c [Chromatiales bacterium]HIO14384.1 cytochrome c [Chromatiales bacterium]HIO53854.1 cytochrome c [Chromatiales bacterium]
MKTQIISIAAAGILSVMSGAVMAGDAAAGKGKAAMCAGCHGANGVSIAPMYPNLAGQKEAYLAKAINDYKSGARNDPTMKAMVGSLSDADIANLAAYFAEL